VFESFPQPQKIFKFLQLKKSKAYKIEAYEKRSIRKFSIFDASKSTILTVFRAPKFKEF
jgi:hypothetical protein